MATEKRLVYANEVEEIFNYEVHMGATDLFDAFDSAIQNATTVDAVEVVHGRWVDRWGGKYANPHYECSECRKSAPYKCDRDVLYSWLWLQDLTPYCPNCGAKMDGDGNGS